MKESEAQIQCQSAAKYLWSQDSWRNTTSASTVLWLIDCSWSDLCLLANTQFVFWGFLERLFHFAFPYNTEFFKDVYPFQFASQEHCLRRGGLVPRKQNIQLVLLLAGKTERSAACQTLHSSPLLAEQHHTKQNTSWVKGHPSALEQPVLNLLRHSSFLHLFCIYNLALATCPNEIQNPVT